MRGMLLLLLLLMLAGWAGCAQPPKTVAPAWTPPGTDTALPSASLTNGTARVVTPSRFEVGKVMLVNPQGRYVVVSYPVGVVSELGQPLNVYRAGLKVGQLKITGPQRDVSVVADILDGECQVGDEVRPD